MNLSGVSIIGFGRGKPSGHPTRAVAPKTGASLEPPYFWASAEDVDRATALASTAFADYSRWPAPKRAGLLRRIAELFESESAGIIGRAEQETALPSARLQGETARTCGQLRLFATLIEEGWWVDARIDHGDPARKPVPKPDVRSMLMPLGPVAVFSSSNFPFAFSVAGGDTASALAAGCPVIVKPHQGHLGTSEIVGTLIQQAAKEAGAPEGTFSLLYGPGRDVGVALVKHPRIKAVGFTGSRAGGRALMDAAAARPEPIPVYAEMGSINPVFMMPGALAESAEALATGLHASVTLGVGQFCTNPGLVFVPDSDSTDRFLSKLKDLFTSTPAGTMLTSSICAEYREGLAKFSNIKGVDSLCLTHAPTGTNTTGSPALFTANAECFLSNPLLLDEVFGPSTLVVRCAQMEQTLACARALDGQLTATLHVSPAEVTTVEELVSILRNKAGRLVWNGFPTGVEVCHAMNHGGPFPATADGRSTSVGTRAIARFARALCFQNFPEAALPPELQETNPLGVWRLVDGQHHR
jgi:NADP-dependent aldehyde dehydrogenase